MPEISYNIPGAQYYPPQNKRRPVRNGIITGAVAGTVIGAVTTNQDFLNQSIEHTINKAAKEKGITEDFTLVLKDGIINAQKGAAKPLTEMAERLKGWYSPAQLMKDAHIVMQKKDFSPGAKTENVFKMAEQLTIKDGEGKKAIATLAIAGAVTGMIIGMLRLGNKSNNPQQQSIPPNRY